MIVVKDCARDTLHIRRRRSLDRREQAIGVGRIAVADDRVREFGGATVRRFAAFERLEFRELGLGVFLSRLCLRQLLGEFGVRALEIVTTRHRGAGIGRISEMVRIGDAGALLLDANLAIEVGHHAPKLSHHEFDLPDAAALSLTAVRTQTVGNKTIYIVGGRRLDQNFLASLELPEGMRALLYRNLEPTFNTSSLTDANGTVRQAPLYFVSPNQINMLIPTNTAFGLATLTVTNPNGASASTIVLITRTAHE